MSDFPPPLPPKQAKAPPIVRPPKKPARRDHTPPTVAKPTLIPHAPNLHKP